MKARSSASCAALILAAIISGCGNVNVGGPAASPSSHSATDDFERRYWRMPVESGEGNVTPERCGGCHQVQYDQWRKSLHAHAMGPGVIGQLRGFDDAEEVSCLLCHAPLTRQQPSQFDLTYREDDFRDGLWFVERAQKKLYESKPRENPRFDRTLAGQGIICAACHVRNGTVYAPPPLPGKSHDTSPHPLVHSAYFETAEFCRTCHQFSPENSVNGKPLENTYEEWKNSIWGRDGAACQSCHMRGRGHHWKGIHDAEMVKSGVRFRFHVESGAVVRAALELENAAVGHFFPTYVTPQILAAVEMLDRAGRTIEGTRQDAWIGRLVELTGEVRREIRDTRIPPGETYTLAYERHRPERAHSIRAVVTVFPDHFYTGMFRTLLAQTPPEKTRADYEQALQSTLDSVYDIFSDTRQLPLFSPNRADR